MLAAPSFTDAPNSSPLSITIRRFVFNANAVFRLEGSLPRNSLLSITDCEFTLTGEFISDGDSVNVGISSVLLNYPYGDPFALSHGSSVVVSENRIYFSKKSANTVHFATLMSSGSITIEASATLNVSSNVLLAANNVSSYTVFRMRSLSGVSLQANATVFADHNVIGDSTILPLGIGQPTRMQFVAIECSSLLSINASALLSVSHNAARRIKHYAPASHTMYVVYIRTADFSLDWARQYVL